MDFAGGDPKNSHGLAAAMLTYQLHGMLYSPLPWPKLVVDPKKHLTCLFVLIFLC